MTSQPTSPVISIGSKNKPLPIDSLGAVSSLSTLVTQRRACLGPVLALVLVAVLQISTPAHAEWILWHDQPDAGRAAVAEIFKEVARLDLLMSTYMERSRISEINREAADRPVAAREELYRLVERSLDISLLTRGAFDITYDSVGQHYDFREGQRPSEQVIAEELPLIDYQLVQLDADNRTVRFLREGVRINLGGIAKGYAVERGIEIARRHGVRHARVTAGGDTRLLGDRRGKPWMVGVQNPRDDREVAVTIPLDNEAISTSGDYERFFDEGDERYHHIIAPSTGTPAGEVHSVTVIGPDAVITDALSTSVFVMGVDEGLRLIATLPDYEGIVIDASSQMYYSSGLQPPD
jgi:thiamine biosynthesis lipoprotein